MDKLIFKILISLMAILFLFVIYLGSSDLIVNPRIIESEFTIENK